MDVDEELIKVYFKLPKLPNETSYNVIHLYSIPQFGKNSFTLKNCNSILKNMGNVGEIYAEAFAITINHLYMHIYQSSNEKCIGYYDTFNILGARNLGKRIDGKTDVFVIKTLSCQNYDCAVLHFFRLSIREDKSFIDKICRTINRNSEKAKSTIITRFSNILDDQAFINKGRYEKEIEALTHCFSQIEDAMKVLNDSIQQRKNIEKRYKDCGFKSLKQRTILRRAGGLSNEEIKDVIQKIRHSFNIICILKPFLSKPNAVDFIHSLFPYLITFVYLYGLENAREIENPYFTESTLKMLAFCLTSCEYEFLRKFGGFWCNSNYENIDLVDDSYVPSFFGTKFGFIKEVQPFGLPEDNERNLLPFNDYRVVRCNYKKREQTELNVKAGEIIIVVLMNETNCFVKNIKNEYGYINLNVLTSPIDLNFNADILVSNLYKRMKNKALPQNKTTKFHEKEKSIHLSCYDLFNHAEKSIEDTLSLSEI